MLKMAREMTTISLVGRAPCRAAEKKRKKREKWAVSSTAKTNQGKMHRTREAAAVRQQDRVPEHAHQGPRTGIGRQTREQSICLHKHLMRARGKKEKCKRKKRGKRAWPWQKSRAHAGEQFGLPSQEPQGTGRENRRNTAARPLQEQAKTIAATRCRFRRYEHMACTQAQTRALAQSDYEPQKRRKRKTRWRSCSFNDEGHKMASKQVQRIIRPHPPILASTEAQ